MEIAKQSTARTVMVGPVLDASGVAVTDGVVGDLKISKNGAAPAGLNASATLTHRHTGHYSLALTASDLDTVGCAQITIDDTVNAMPPKEITVIEEVVYDGFFAASALGYIANAPVNVSQFGGSNGTFSSGRPEVNTTHAAGTAWNSAAIGAATLASDTIAAAKIATGAITAAKFAAGAIDAAAIADNAIDAGALATGAITSAKFAAGAIDAAAIAADAIGASELAADAATEIGTAVWATTTRLLTAGTNIALAKGTGVTGFNDLSAAQVNTEVDTAIADARLDELLAADSDIDGAAPPTVGSVFHELMTKTTGSFTFDQTTDSLEAVRDNMGTAQTGDAFARLGAPAGASVSADILVIDNLVDDLESRIGTPSNLGGGATVAANLADIEAQTDDIGVAGAGLTALASAAALATVDGIVDDILVDTGTTLQAELDGIQADTEDIQTRLPAALVSGRIDASVGAMAANVLTATAINADAITAAKLAADVTTELQAGLATAAALTTVDTVVDAIKVTTDKVDDTLEDDAGTFRFTANALEEAPTGGSAPTAAAIADAVWEETLTDHSGTAGSTAEALGAAGSAGDPWATALPGSYSSGQAGKIIGDNLNATVGSRATQTSVDDVPTNAELATALGTADDAVLAAIAALNNLSIANVRTAVGLASANLDTQLGDLPTNAELATALASADDAVLAAIAALNNLSSAQAQTAAAAALTAYDPPTRAEATSDKAEILTAVGDVPTNAELSTALAAADDAVLAAIAALNNLSAAQVNAEVDTAITDAALATAAALSTAQTAITAIKAKSDSLTFTVAGHVDANVQQINDVALLGDGAAVPWGPA